jgi:hypothetical protein
MVERFETALIVHLTPFEVQTALENFVRQNFVGIEGRSVTMLEPEKNEGAQIVIRKKYEAENSPG